MNSLTIRLFLLLLSTLSFSSVYPYTQDTIRGKVEDEKGKPVKGIKVWVSKKFSGTSSSDGSVVIPFSGKLKMPLDVVVSNSDYSLKEHVFFDDDNTLEIVLKENALVSESEESISKKSPSLLTRKSNDLSLYKETDMYAEIGDTSTSSFSNYKIEINRITEELVLERNRLEENNEKIREDITDISGRLQNEEGLSIEQRQELQLYIERMEKTMLENNLAFTKAHEKTNELIFTLKSIIAEKDSIARVAQKLAVESDKKREVAERKLNRNLIIFSIISLSLLILAITFYSIAYKIRKQKNALTKTNYLLVESQNDLTNKIFEINQQSKLIEEQIQQLDTFVYKVSHDLKGPLKSLQKLAELGLLPTEAGRSAEYFSFIQKTAIKLNTLVVDLLDVAKAKTTVMEKTEVNFTDLIKDCLERFENLPEYKTCTISVNIGSEVVFYSDEKILLSLFQNMIENGIKYQDPSKEKRMLNIDVNQEGANLIVKFEDNGIGIAKEHHDRLFDMFYKVNPESNGTGLGLHIIKLNVNKLGGKIEVSSIEGQGSCFKISFENNNIPLA